MFRDRIAAHRIGDHQGGRPIGYLTSRDRYLKPSRSRVLFLLLGAAAFVVTETGRFVYRPYAREHGLHDFGLADSVGNLGGIVTMIFLALAVINPTRRQSYRLAAFYALGFILYEFAQPVLPRGVFDWQDVGATVIGYLITLPLLALVWRSEPMTAGED